MVSPDQDGLQGPENVNGPLGESDLFPEDPFLSSSLSSLPSVPIPSNFLPNVMFQVYEKHHRGKISLWRVVVFSIVLTLLSCGFFIGDVLDYKEAHGKSDFQAAFSDKVDLMLADFDSLFSAFTSILTASWQIVTGAGSLFFSNTPIVVQLMILAGIVALVYFIRKGLAGFGRY